MEIGHSIYAPLSLEYGQLWPYLNLLRTYDSEYVHTLYKA